MKMEFWLLILVLCNATNSIESVNSPQNNIKLYKTFDEIFGEGWDDEEKPKLSEPNESQRMEASSTKNRHENSDHTEQPEDSLAQNDRPQIDYNDNIQSNQVPVELVKNEKACSEGHKKVKCYSDDKKHEIVQKFIEFKNKFMQEKKHSHNEWNQFKANISKELGVSHGTVFKWKKQFFGLDKKLHSDEQRLKKLKEYYEIKLRNPTINDTDIAAALKISIGTLFNWKAQFKHVPELNVPKSNGPPFSLQNNQSQVAPSSIKRCSDERKHEIVEEYIALKDKFSQEKKHSRNEWKQFKANIFKELGVSYKTIFKWKKQFFGVNKKMYTDKQKLQKLKEYYEIKLRNPKTKDRDIAAALQISIGTLHNWKSQFKQVPELNVPKSNGPLPV